METSRERIASTIASDKVVLFMKGSRQAPQCGFSAKLVSILDQFLPSYTTVNVLEDADVRQGIKEFSSWPTIPQLYIQGEFVGGCDIVTDLYQSGELEAKLGVSGVDVAPPAITVTDSAALALKDAVHGDEHLRLDVDGRYQHDLSVGPLHPKDIVVTSNGVSIAFSRTSAARANGIVIDFVKSPNGPAFKIDNPNEPPRVKAMTVTELADRLKAGDALELYDVRTKEEREKARIEGAKHFDDAARASLEKLDKSVTLAFHCHHGGRSQAAAEHYVSQGWKSVYNVVGGIDAWSREVDSSVERY